MKNNNTGNSNTGDWNTGDSNTGYKNTGDWNTGSRNTGDWNTGSRNTGYLNTNRPSQFRIFNKETTTLLGDVIFPEFFYYNVVEWVEEDDMLDWEKESYPTYLTMGGYLKSYTDKEAWLNSWNNTGDEDRRRCLALPNWDNAIFKEISGIDVEAELNIPKRTVEDILVDLDGEDREILKNVLMKY